MKNKKISIIFLTIIILFANINEYFSSYLPTGLIQLNHFIYLDRMKIFSIQDFTKQCSLNMGPNCYFTENIRNINYHKDNLQKIIDKINLSDDIDFQKEWMEVYDKSKNSYYLTAYNEIDSYISKYKKYISPKTDSQQIPPTINLYLSLTFESYDDITIKGDTYALSSKIIRYYTENINLEIIGKLRLSYGEDLKLKNQMRYPSKTFGIVESSNLTIKLGGKIFICEYFYLRIKKENINKINISGFLGISTVFSIQKDIKTLEKNEWNKINLPNKEIDRLLLPGGIEVDNFRFVMETLNQYYITVQFHKNQNERIKNLVEDSDI